MHHFFVEPSQISENRICVTGSDVNHIRNVLRIRPGEEVLVSDGLGTDYICRTEELKEDRVELQILEISEEGTELPAEIWLFQGLPKSDKMELIIQKAVELGAAGIVPVATCNAVVKLDAKKAEAKTKRWQTIAESAAKQSKRSRIPQVKLPVRMKEAFEMLEREGFTLRMIPYEREEGMEGTRKVIGEVKPGEKIAVFIGPEGGFTGEEIRQAMDYQVQPISLGKRILRTETAGLSVLSLLMLKLEGAVDGMAGL